MPFFNSFLIVYLADCMFDSVFKPKTDFFSKASCHVMTAIKRITMHYQKQIYDKVCLPAVNNKFMYLSPEFKVFSN